MSHKHGKPSFIQLQTGGPVGEFGNTNGCGVEDLIEMAVDRLGVFQRGAFPCKENLSAIKSLRDAKGLLDDRAVKRMKQGVEGTLALHK